VNLSVGKRWESFINRIVSTGRYDSADDVVREGLRLLEEREAKLADLRETLNRSVEAGGEVTPEALDAALDAEEARLAAHGH
jgi:antitoxin ParD1/3/4